MHYTRKLEEFVAQWSRVMTIGDVADLAGLSWDVAKRIVKRRLRRDYGRIDLHGVRHLSIDEIYVGKRRGYYTLVLDLDSGRILWVSPGRGKAGLQGFWRRLRRSRARIGAVAMDMSGAYYAAVLEELPGVPIVFDRYHVIQLMNQRLDELRREMVREATGPLKLAIKGTRYLLLTRVDNLEAEQLPKLERALKLNEPLSQGWYSERGTGLALGTGLLRGDESVFDSVVRAGPTDRCATVAANGQDAAGTPARPLELLVPSHQQWPYGGHE